MQNRHELREILCGSKKAFCAFETLDWIMEQV